MAAKKRRASGAKIASERKLMLASMKAGQKLAQKALRFRARQHRRRREQEADLAKPPAQRRQLKVAPAPSIPARTRRMLASRVGAGVLIAEGDSWFDYPIHDVLQLLEDEHHFDVESAARKGDRVEDMAHGAGQFEELARRLEKLLRADKVPRAILLSGGGNDIAGEHFSVLLNHVASDLPPLNEDIVRGVIDVRIRAAYASIIAGLTAIATRYLDGPIPIITHGYGNAVPDGRGFLGGFWFLPGPWLEPGFREKGYEDLRRNREVVATLIERFNKMLQAVCALPEFKHVHYLDLRRTLRSDARYKDDWANELHPTTAGFRSVAGRFAELISRLPG